MTKIFRAAGIAAAAMAFAASATFAAPFLSLGVGDSVVPLSALIAHHGAVQSGAAMDAETECLANAVYFEARSEPIEGQLAVAEVVLNRAASGKYPRTICRVVTQPSQFSFIRAGRFPRADRNSEAWRTASAIADIAKDELADELASNILWYHATYVSPSWGKRLRRETQIGAHIFYS